jgi:hypothetical protein
MAPITQSEYPEPDAWRLLLLRWNALTHLPVLDDAQLENMSAALMPKERLLVRHISYGSPGSLDLAGVGVVVGHIKDFILRLVERKDLQRKRQLDEERAALQNETIRLENARNFIDIARDVGYTDSEIRRMTALVDEKQEIFVRVTQTGRLRSVLSIADDRQ